ncbi:MAG: sigma factor, ECF-like family protein [Gemmatimonadetes bacterium]|nr:sigma factor, ECF-like family protein [Gemmatimonadota bacterium]
MSARQDGPGEGKTSLDVLFPRVYSELHELAERFLWHEREGHTLSPTALVHEAYLRLAAQDVPPADRGRFFGLAAEMMRRILVNHALARRAAKRGGDQVCITLEESLASDVPETELDVIALDEALQRLTAMDPRAGQIVELRFFAGLGVEETAAVLDISPATVKREWSASRAWLRRELASA